MPSSQSRITLLWSAPDGKETAIGLGVVEIRVAEGVSIHIEPNVDDDAQLTVDLDLHTVDTVRELSGPAGKRFVIIPVDESSALVGVAEPSELPACLCPVPSTPAWVAPNRGSMSATDGSLLVRDSTGVRLMFRLLPASEMDNMSMCVVQVTSASDHNLRPGFEKARSVLSILRSSPGSIRIAATS